MKVSARQRVTQSRLYALTRDIKWRLENHVSKNNRDRFRVVSLAPQDPPKGSVLLSRLNRAFLLKAGEAIPATHQNLWEVYQMSRIFLELGYSVDVIDYTNDSFVPQKEYSMFVDAKWNLERIGPLLDRKCVKVLHAVTAHPLFHNAAELRRLLALQQRRGVTLQPRRQERLNWGIEHADCATVLGNGFTLSTYRYANKPLYPVPLATPLMYPWPEQKDFGQCRSQFLFFAGEGMIHKGLDLVLEAFAAMPQHSLTVCGPVEKEQDFVKAYQRELYDTANIRVAGWLDVSSEKFVDIANGCIALIHPSCSESGCASVITGMHAGLIPIVSYESSVDVSPGCGIVLQRSSIAEIQQAVQSIAGLPASRLQEMAKNVWHEARENHSSEKFIAEYKRAMSRILTLPGKECIPTAPEVAIR